MMYKRTSLLMKFAMIVAVGSGITACAWNADSRESVADCQREMVTIADIERNILQKKSFRDVPLNTTEGRHVEFFYDSSNALRAFDVTYYGEMGKTKYAFGVSQVGTYHAKVQVLEYSQSIDSGTGNGKIHISYEKQFEVCRGQLLTELLSEVDERTWGYVKEDFQELYLLGTQYRNR